MATSRLEFFDADFLNRLDRLRLIAKGLSGRSSSAVRRSRRLADGLQFVDHRDYTGGDDSRFIDWPYFARMEKLLVRLFHEHSESDVTILLDTSASMAPDGQSEKFDFARRTTAALAYVAMAGFVRVRVQTFANHLGESVSTGRNRAQILEVLDFLADLQTGERTLPVRCIQQFVRSHTRPGTVLIISDLLDCRDQLSDALARLRLSGHDVTVLHVISPHDASPTLEGAMLLRQAEGDNRLTVNVSEDLLESYRLQWDEFCQDCRTICLSQKALYQPLATDVPFERLILSALQSAGVVGV